MWNYDGKTAPGLINEWSMVFNDEQRTFIYTGADKRKVHMDIA